MKNFKFSLEKILNFKEQVLKSLKNDLSNLMVLLSNKDKEINEIKELYVKIENDYKEKTENVVLSYEIQYYKNYLSTLINKINKCLVDRKVILKKIDSKKNEIVEVNKEISSLDKLKEKKLDEYNKHTQKQEELFIEEFVNTCTIMNSRV